jgi:hypothetical protein
MSKIYETLESALVKVADNRPRWKDWDSGKQILETFELESTPEVEAILDDIIAKGGDGEIAPKYLRSEKLKAHTCFAREIFYCSACNASFFSCYEDEKEKITYRDGQEYSVCPGCNEASI